MHLLDQPLGALARDIPGATRVLRHYGFDFCCNGHESARSAATRIGLLPEELEQALRAIQPQAGDIDWRRADPVQLIAHIETRYHAAHRQQLPELIRLAERVERVHAGKPGCPTGLAAQLTRMHNELLQHMHKEEQILFPLLSAGMHAQAQGPINVMRHEHLQHAAELKEVSRLADDLVPPAHACTTWRALYTGLQQFRDDLTEHIHLENNLLFEGLTRTEVAHG